MGSVWGDFDNDGWEDVLVYKYGRPELFRNVEGRSLLAVGERAGLPAWVNSNSATWLDYDRDGYLDLFIAGYWPDAVNLGSSRLRRSCRRASSTRTTAAASTCCAIAAMERSRTA